MKIEIRNTAVISREIEREGKPPWKLYEQEAWLHLDQYRRPQRIAIEVQAGHVGLQPGYYEILDESYEIRWGRLTLKRQLELNLIDEAKLQAVM